MSAFTAAEVVPVRPAVRRRPCGPRLHVCVTPLVYEVGWLGSGWAIVVPAGFQFDLSAPWWIAWTLPRRRMLKAAALHDFARTQLGWSLWFSDLLFLDAMKAEGVAEPLRTLAWHAVRSNNNRA